MSTSIETVPTPATMSRQTGEPFWQRRRAVIALRGAAVLVGVAGALAGLVVAGLLSLLAGCGDGATGLCTNHAGLVPVIEWAIVIAAFAAPLAGGIASCWRKQWQWLAGGLVVAAAMALLAIIVSSGQHSVLS